MATANGQASGGKRRGDKRRAQRAEMEAASPVSNAQATERLKSARIDGDGPAAAGVEAVRTLREAKRLAEENEAVPLSQRIRDVVHAAAALVKATDPEGRLEEMAADLRAAHAHIEKLEERLRAQAKPARDPGGLSAPPLQ